MGLLHESRLDNTVDAGSIGIGERVDIKTRMGNHVAAGEVVATSPFGVVLRECGFFGRDVYLFSPIEEDPPVVAVNAIADSLDRSVAEKLRQMGEDNAIVEMEKIDDREDGDEDDEGDEGDDSDDGKGVVDKPLAATGSSVDVDKLPEDIKKAIVSTTQMDEDQLNGVMSEIGDATVKALKRMGVRDTEVYVATSKVQNAVYRILTGNPPAPPAPARKKAKK